MHELPITTAGGVSGWQEGTNSYGSCFVNDVSTFASTVTGLLIRFFAIPSSIVSVLTEMCSCWMLSNLLMMKKIVKGIKKAARFFAE